MTSQYQEAVQAVRAGAEPEQQAEALHEQLTDQERLWLLDGDLPFWEGMAEMMVAYNTVPLVAGEVARLGIPGLRFSDGPRGVVMGASTAFPVSMARGATWDVALEERVGRAIGAEVRAQGGNFFAGVCINLPRHPAWGRAQETYGEDPVLLGELGAALTRGVREQVMACVKHYALNSMENARFQIDVSVAEDVLHEVYLPHFRRVVEEGADSVMTAYNSVNGQWCGQNRALITDILRGTWGFRGVVISDFIMGLRDAAASLAAGLDVEEPFRQQRAQHLPDDLAAGRASWADVRAAGLRTLAAQLRFEAGLTAPAPAPEVVACAEHRALAREVAARSMVLLRNEPVDGAALLPVDAAALTSVAVIGRLADVANTGDHGSSDVRAPSVVTALEGLRAALPGVQVRHVPQDDPELAARVAGECDLAVVVAGYTALDEGEYVDPSVFVTGELTRLYPPLPEGAAQPEVSVAGPMAGNAGGDRASLRLREVDEAIITAVAAANPRTVVAVVAAGAVLMETWRHQVPGLLMSWYAGMEGGHALADVLLGRAEPAGRLPFSVPTSEEHLPAFDRDATTITYDRWHGQRLLDRLGVAAAYPLGFGLGYTTFQLAGPSAEQTGDEQLTVRVEVRNTGTRDGRHVVQVYGSAPSAPPGRHLLGFTVVPVPAGGSSPAEVRASLRPLSRWDAGAGRLHPPNGTVDLQVASYAGDPDAGRLAVELG